MALMESKIQLENQLELISKWLPIIEKPDGWDTGGGISETLETRTNSLIISRFPIFERSGRK